MPCKIITTYDPERTEIRIAVANIQTGPYGTVLIKVPKKKVLTILSYDPKLRCYKGKYKEVFGCVNTLWLYGIDQQMKINAEKHYTDSIKLAKIKRSQDSIRMEVIELEKTLPKVGDTLICTVTTVLYYRDKSDDMGVLNEVPFGSEVIYNGYIGNALTFYKVIYNDIDGFMFKEKLSEKNNGLQIVQQEKREQARIDSIANQYKKERKAAELKRKNELIRKYGQTNDTKIYEGKIWLGMTDEMTLESWGNPKDINRSVGSWGIHEQWVYGDTYLYFENGILTSWQD